MNTLQAVIARTAAGGHTDKELLLVQSKAHIERPATRANGHAHALHTTRYPVPSQALAAAATAVVK